MTNVRYTYGAEGVIFVVWQRTHFGLSGVTGTHCHSMSLGPLFNLLAR